MSTQADAASGPATGDAGKATMSLSDAITAAFGPDERGGVDAGAQDEVTPPADIDDELTNPEAAKHAQRNKGKQQNAGDDRGGEDATDGEDNAAETAAKAATEKPVSNAKAAEAPKHWPADDRAAFAKLPQEGQATLLKLAKNLEGGFTRKSQEMADKVKFADSVSGLFDAETRAQLKRAGSDESGAIRYLLDTQRFATKEPVKYVGWAMQQLGVTPEMLGLGPQTQDGKAKAEAVAKQGQEADPSDRSVEDLLSDPAVKQLRTELSEAKQLLTQQQDMIQRITGNLSAREQQEREFVQSRQQQHRDQLAGTIQGFRTQLDDSGQLAFPHFDKVARQMGALMDTHPALSQLPDGPEKMKLAYEHAVWADPELRVSLVEAEASKKAHAAEKAREVQRAKRTVTAKPAIGAPSVKAKVGSVDAAIDAAMTKAGF